MVFLPFLIGLAVMILAITIGWRIMRAFESIAKSISDIAEKQK
jgi:hypothetical protein